MSSAAEAVYQRLAANPTIHTQMRFSGTTGAKLKAFVDTGKPGPQGIQSGIGQLIGTDAAVGVSFDPHFIVG
jgi:hypothetical protein